MKTILDKLHPSRITYRKTHHPSTEERFWSNVDKDSYSPCWYWTGNKNRKRYGVLSVDGVKLMAHRISWELIHGEIPEGMLICHTCDNPPCVNPAHLFLGTNSDNQKDSVRKGRNKIPNLKGEDCLNAKLSRKKVKEIRRLRMTEGLTYYELAKMYGVSYQLIGDVVIGKRWKI